MVSRALDSFSPNPAFGGRAPAGRERFFLGLAAGLLGLLLAAASRYDLAWSWFFAAYPGLGPVGRLYDTLLQGGPPGMTEAILTAYLAAGALHAASRLSGRGRLPGAGWSMGRLRRASGTLLAVGWMTVVTVLALRMIFARPVPTAVFGGAHPFRPWFLPGGLPAGLGLAASSFPSFQTALLASCAAFVLVWLPGARGGGRGTLLAVALPLVAVHALFGVHQQLFWPSDAVLGAAVGWGWAWLLDRRGRRDGWPLRLAGWGLAVALSSTALVLGLRIALQNGAGWGWGLAALGVGGVAILLKLGQNAWAAAGKPAQ